MIGLAEGRKLGIVGLMETVVRADVVTKGEGVGFVDCLLARILVVKFGGADEQLEDGGARAVDLVVVAVIGVARAEDAGNLADLVATDY